MIRANDLTSAEKRVWDAFPDGREVDFQVGDPDLDHPAQAAAWGPDRVIRAVVLRSLLLGARKPAAGEIAAIRMVGARITGRLDLDSAEIQHRIRMVACAFDESVWLYNAKMRRVTLSRSHLPGLSASGAVFDGSLRLTGCRITGEVHLVGAHIVGALRMESAHISRADGTALCANRLRVDDDLLMTDGFTVEGMIDLRGAKTGGALTLTGAKLSAPHGFALTASRLEVGTDLRCDRVEAVGQVRMAGATIAGVALFIGTRLSNPDSVALHLNDTRIGAGLLFRAGFRAEGEVRLKGVRVVGHVDFDGAVVKADGTWSVTATGAEITRSFYCTAGFEATGMIRFDGARIGGVLSFDDATLSSDSDRALSLAHVRADEVNLRTRTRPSGTTILAHATIRLLSDELDSCSEVISMDGLAYDKLNRPGTVEQRIAWLRRERDGYRPQPYEQLAAVYRRMGHEGDARRVLLAKQHERRRTLPLAARIWGVVQEATVGYGYRPERALGWLALLLAMGTTVFGMHRPVFTGTAPAPTFNALIYSLDLLLPVVNFGQSKVFTATGGYQWFAYLLTAAGWILATTIAAGLARAVNRT